MARPALAALSRGRRPALAVIDSMLVTACSRVGFSSSKALDSLQRQHRRLSTRLPHGDLGAPKLVA